MDKKILLWIIGIALLLPIVSAGKVNYSIYASCASDSMAPTLGCYDKLIVNTVNPGDNLVKGEIYCYQKGIYGRTRILVCHRLIRIEGNSLAFLGDNNAFEDDTVQRRQVAWKIINF